MNCMEARRMIIPYVKGELSDRDLEQFLKHIEQCSDCMDELDIYFTVYRALDTLDTGEKHEYDFKKMLMDSIRISKTRILLGRIRKIVQSIFICCAGLLLIFSIWTGIQMALGYEQASVLDRVMLRFQPASGRVLVSETEPESIQLLSEQIEALIRERNPSVWQKTMKEKEAGQEVDSALTDTENQNN